MEAYISVIVPIYNVEQYLSQCIESICNQSLKEIEIILVNDGSTDKSGGICEIYACKDERIKVFHQNNQGLIAARKRGLIESTCKYVTFVDADDFISDISYVLAKESIKNSIDIIMFNITRYFDSENQSTEIPLFQDGIYYRKEIENWIYPSMIWNEKRNNFGIDPSLCTKIMKKKLVLSCYDKLKDINFYYGEDTAVIYPMLKEAKTVEINSYSYYYHRQRKKTEVPIYIKDIRYFDKLYGLYKYMIKEFEDNKILLRQIEYFYIHSVGLRRQLYKDYNGGLCYLFPFDKVKKGSKVIVYGAGVVGHSFVKQIKKIDFCKLVLWVDKNYQDFNGENVSSIEGIKFVSFDLIIIAVENIEISNGIKRNLVDMGVKPKQIISNVISID